MKPKLSLSIPKPCHENWNAMTPELQGRFCGQCSKTVVDFTLMTDGQILDTLKKETGKTCGRFTNDQLERPLISPAKPKWYAAGLWKYIISAGLLSKTNESSAQTKTENSENVVVVQCGAKPKKILGKIAVSTPTATSKFEITVKDENGNALPFATLTLTSNNKKFATNEHGKSIIEAVKGDKLIASYIGYNSIEIILKNPNTTLVLKQKDVKKHGEVIVVGMVSDSDENRYYFEQKSNIVYTIVDEKSKTPLAGATIVINKNGKTQTEITDKQGKVKLKRIKERDELKLTISSIGYKEKTITINNDELKEGKNKLNIELEQNIIKHDDAVVVVAGYLVKRKLSCGVKGESVSIKTDTLSKVKNFVDTLLNIKPSFKIYPNPVVAGSAMNIGYTSKLEEYILIQLFAADGKWLKQEKLKVVIGENILAFEIPNNIEPQNAKVAIMNSIGKNIGTQQLVIMN
jgi:uncharacterized protein YdeI (BOF family)